MKNTRQGWYRAPDTIWRFDLVLVEGKEKIHHWFSIWKTNRKQVCYENAGLRIWFGKKIRETRIAGSQKRRLDLTKDARGRYLLQAMPKIILMHKRLKRHLVKVLSMLEISNLKLPTWRSRKPFEKLFKMRDHKLRLLWG